MVTSITQFGAFVDIGIKENGLLHVSQISDNFVDNAMDALKVGQEVKVQVIDLDLDRGRISLSAKKGAEVNRSSATSTRDNRGQSNNKSIPQQRSQEMKNNAFAGLKNFKL